MLRLVQAFGIRVQHQLAGSSEIAIQLLLLHEAIQGLATLGGQRQQLHGGLAGDRGPAGGQELHAPAPLLRAPLRGEAQGTAAVEQQLGDTGQQRRVGQRLHIAVAQLCTVTGYGAHAGPGCLVDHRDPMPGLVQEPGTAQADDARAYHANLHYTASLSNAQPLGLIWCQSVRC